MNQKESSVVAAVCNHVGLEVSAPVGWHDKWAGAVQVMAQGLLLQLWGPLSFLGWFYRELRQSLVDMEQFFGILSQTTNLPDGTRDLPTSSMPSVSSKS